ncbi:MAG TPA: glycoside hydrolase family 73 protein [Lactovum miscens]|uniref:glycoside hydrolase family 73 protein n=1 Tax=Lactovum miscens TaxID=190387 RepID=UPI002EDADD92
MKDGRGNQRKQLKMKEVRRRRKFLRLFLIFILLFLELIVSKGTPESYNSAFLETQLEVYKEYNFIRKIAPMAKAKQNNYGLLSSITIAQACLESDFGESSLASKYHNLFGVKSYLGENSVTLSTKEFQNGKWITINGTFKVYSSWEASIDAHTQLLVNGVDWDPVHYLNVLETNDYKVAAQDLQNDGYATDPNYGKKLIGVINEYHLSEYDY